MITLKDFVRETLSQIVEGVNEFTEQKAEVGATTYPRMTSMIAEADMEKVGVIFAGFGPDKGANYVTKIDFDIAISATDTETAAAGGGIRVLSLLRADGSLETQTANAAVSRVRFTLPLQPR
jgi:hypothetical protein